MNLITSVNDEHMAETTNVNVTMFVTDDNETNTKVPHKPRGLSQ